MERRDVLMIRDGALAAGLSFFLYKLTSSATFFIIPLLLAAPRLIDVKRALLPVAAVLVLLLGDSLIGLKGVFADTVLAVLLLVGLYMPVSLLVGAACWIGLAKRRMLIRFLYGSIFAAIGGFLLIIWFRSGSEAAGQAGDSLKNMYVVIADTFITSALPVGLNSETLFTIMVAIVESAYLPIFMVQFGLSVMASELFIHRTDWEYQKRMSKWRLPVNAVWAFLGGWTMVLATTFVKLPLFVATAWNLALTVSLLYFVQGISIVAYLVRKRNERISATRMFILMFVTTLIPGINVILFTALLLLGVSETWIRYRVNE